MIPYEDLVSALTVWRERNGLPTGASDYLGEPPAPEPVSFAAYESRPHAEVEEVLVTEDWDAEPEPVPEPEPESEPVQEASGEDWSLLDALEAVDEAPVEDAPAEQTEHGFSTDDLIAAHGESIAADLAVEEAYEPGGSGGDDIWGPTGEPRGEPDDLAAFGDETFNEPIDGDEYPPLETESPPTVDQDLAVIADNFDPPPPIEPAGGEATAIGVEPAPEDDSDDFF